MDSGDQSRRIQSVRVVRLKADPLQKKDISKQRPEVTNRLKKKLLTLYKDVMADAPDWPSK